MPARASRSGRWIIRVKSYLRVGVATEAAVGLEQHDELHGVLKHDAYLRLQHRVPGGYSAGSILDWRKKRSTSIRRMFALLSNGFGSMDRQYEAPHVSTLHCKRDSWALLRDD